MTALVKRTPLAARYRAHGAAVTDLDGWEVAVHFGNPDAEVRALAEGAVLVDWSHLGKLRIRGADAAEVAARLLPAAGALAVLRAAGDAALAVLRLVADEFLVLCPPERARELLEAGEGGRSAITDQSGALGALLLGGPQRAAIAERSSEMDLSPRGFRAGHVAQTAVHSVPCTVYRSAHWDLYLQTRDYTESLFAAFLDVGGALGLVPAGIGCMPTQLALGAEHV